MIEIHLKYDSMHIFVMINALNYINNHVNSCINSMLAVVSNGQILIKLRYFRGILSNSIKSDEELR